MAKEKIEEIEGRHTVKFLLNPENNQVTRVICTVSRKKKDKAGFEERPSSEFTSEDLSRLCGYRVISGDSEGIFFMRDRFLIRDIPGEHKELVTVFSGVADVSIIADEELMNYSYLFRKLEELRNEIRRYEERGEVEEGESDKVDFLISYIHHEGWYWRCEDCDNFMSMSDLIRNLTTSCSKCLNNSN